ncbi:MAG: S-methyl-5-thioribose-1-phosphate isomerase, partial [Thermoplasmatales archaeon]
PLSTFDFSIESGAKIPIEYRDENEVALINDSYIPPRQSHTYNPAFDVTPAKYVTGYITEYGIFKSEELPNLKERWNEEIPVKSQ